MDPVKIWLVSGWSERGEGATNIIHICGSHGFAHMTKDPPINSEDKGMANEVRDEMCE